MQRRQFIRRVAGAAAVASTTSLSAGRAFGANDRVRVGLVGCGGRGMTVARLMGQVPGVEFVAACDVYEPHAAAARDWAGAGCRAHRDFRDVLDRKGVDAVLVATPDHWHALITVRSHISGRTSVLVLQPRRMDGGRG